MPTLPRVGRTAFVVSWACVFAVATMAASTSATDPGVWLGWEVLLSIGQALLLGTIVGWHWAWAPATFGGAALRAIVLQLIPYRQVSTVAYIQVAGLAGAVPQFLLLLRYGPRSVAWLAVPVLISETGAAIPSAVMRGLVTGVIQGVVLAWILKSEFSEERTIAAEPIPPPSPVLARSRSQLDSVRIFLAALLVMTVPIAVPQLFVESHTRPTMPLIWMMLGVAVPWAVALILLGLPRFHHAGFVLAATASILTLVPLIPILGLDVLHNRNTSRVYQSSLPYLSLLCATGLLILIAIEAARGARRIPAAERSRWAVPAAVFGFIGYAVLLGEFVVIIAP